MFKVNNKDTRTTPFSRVPIAKFEHVIASWAIIVMSLTLSNSDLFKDTENRFRFSVLSFYFYFFFNVGTLNILKVFRLMCVAMNSCYNSNLLQLIF